ncbi:GH23871 [Drosophila grimshawi]|uniref:GH23871 n=1 Tax=Drosophila grimshawi TaxID=7222 RepID=B4K238_DROGR|nr:GH23871 [Drosophila grimshawi]
MLSVTKSVDNPNPSPNPSLSPSLSPNPFQPSIRAVYVRWVTKYLYRVLHSLTT